MSIPEELIKSIESNCYADEITGDLLCKFCKRKVVVDWFEKELSCSGCDNL